MPSGSYEAKIILALEAINKDNNVSILATVKIYNVTHATVRQRCAGPTCTQCQYIR
jgi:pyruvate/2-oxoglutarate/acetoin dehydrogenase E1 component